MTWRVGYDGSSRGCERREDVFVTGQRVVVNGRSIYDLEFRHQEGIYLEYLPKAYKTHPHYVEIPDGINQGKRLFPENAVMDLFTALVKEARDDMASGG